MQEQQAIQRAVELFGVTALSQWLKVPSDTITDWMTGNGEPPGDIFREVARLIAGRGAGIRVLIAAERDTQMTLGILLRSEGFLVELAGGAKVGEAVRRFRPHAVLLDIGMPHRGGDSIAEELRTEHGERCPVLVAIGPRAGEPEIRRNGAFQHRVAKADADALLDLLASLEIGL
jgi:CheY-like chemotaxis protein